MSSITSSFFKAISRFGVLDGSAVLASLALLCLSFLLIWLLIRRYSSLAALGYCLGTLILFRFVFFGNPLSWGAHFQLLNWKEVGFQQRGAMSYEFREWISPYPELRYLAIGDSQTGSLYKALHGKSKELLKWEFPSMQVTDYLFYVDDIIEVGPKYVLLYLSEDSISLSPNLDTMYYTPEKGIAQLWSWGKFLKANFLDVLGADRVSFSLKQLWVSDWLPEYKFNFVPRGYKQKLLSKHKRIKTEQVMFEQSSKKDVLLEELEFLEDSITPERLKYLEPNMEIFEKFLVRVVESGSCVVIVKGGFHQDTLTERRVALRKKAFSALESSVGKVVSEINGDSKISIIDQNDILKFEKSDFSDARHFSAEKGLKLANSIFEHSHSMSCQ